MMIGERLLADEFIISLNSRIETSTRVRWYQDHVRSAVINLSSQNQFSSLGQWLESLKWDGESRINSFFHDAYGCKLNTYTCECGRILFLSGIARAMEPGCQSDVMIVMIGRQGTGKSMGIASLSPFPAWYTDDLGGDLFEGKAGEGLRGKWIFEFAEFARINRATIESVKSFLSRRADHYRPPWDRMARDFPRTCIFVGTTNNQHPLMDLENRRFMPIQCQDGNTTWIKRNREQLWAEAFHRYQSGEHWWIEEQDIIDECKEIQEDHRLGDAWETIVDVRLLGREKTSMEEVVDILGIKWDRLDRSIQTRIGFVLNALGFNRRRVRERGVRSYVYERRLDQVGPVGTSGDNPVF